MRTRIARFSGGSKSPRSRRVRPELENLEHRRLLYAVSGDHFTYGSRITWSIVPDGTNLAGTSSNLISTFNNRFGSGNWLQAFQAAAAQWENIANVNLVQIGDDGEASDAGSLQQGNTNFGDIRIGGYAQDLGTLAFTLMPPAANGGSNSGDITLNTSQPWQLNNDFDVETVAFHELGHALGLDHSTDTNAAMYAYYNYMKQGPDQDDISGVQSIWGPRAEDGLAQGWCNYLGSNYAADISPFINGSNQITLAYQDVAKSGESYWFKVKTPASTASTLSVAIQSSYLSELSPKVQLYNSSLQGLSQVTASATSYGAVIGVSVNNVLPNTTYYIKVAGSNTGPTGTGAYAMLVNMGTTGMPLVWGPVTQVAAQPDQGGGSSPDKVDYLSVAPGYKGPTGGHHSSGVPGGSAKDTVQDPTDQGQTNYPPDLPAGTSSNPFRIQAVHPTADVARFHRVIPTARVATSVKSDDL